MGREYNQKPRFNHIECNGVLRFNFQWPKEYMSLDRRNTNVLMDMSTAATRHPATRPRAKSLGEKDPDMMSVTFPRCAICMLCLVSLILTKVREYELWQRQIRASWLWSCRGGDAPPLESRC